mgnify:CR=1 FL=1
MTEFRSRREALRLLFAAFLFLSQGVAAQPFTTKAPVLTLLDDTRGPIRTPMEVCTWRGQDRSCVTRDGAPAAFPVEGVASVDIEGPEHGPVSVPGPALVPDAEGRLPIVVPRKARLRLPREEQLTLSLYTIDDADLARPRHRVWARTKDLFVPAGAWLASFLGTSEGEAPDLHVLRLKPGEVLKVPRSTRRGWSLVVRTTEAGSPLESVDVTVRHSGDEAPDPGPVRARSSVEGLALFPGLTPGDVDVEAVRAGFASARRPRVSAREGSFTLRTVDLEKAGAILLRLESSTLPVSGVVCRLLDNEPRRPERSEPSRKILQASRTDEDGAVRFEGVSRGRYAVRILPGGRFGVDEGVDVESGQTAEKTVSIERIPVSGTVTRGGEPVSEATVQVRSRASAGLPGDPEGFVRSATDEEGRYEAEVFTEGPHDFVLFLGELPVESRRVFVTKSGTDVDFDLNEHAVRGMVVDDDGKPVPEATVALRLGTFHRLADSAEDGRFEFPILGRGTARLLASRRGYRDSEPSLVEIGDGPPPETLLTLVRLPAIRGRLLLSGGGPAPGQLVASADHTGNLLEVVWTEANGEFEVRGEKDGPTWLLTGGALCPLATTSVSSGQEEAVFRCASLPASISLSLRNETGAALPREALLLSLNGGPVPLPFLQQHLAALGLPPTTDASGRIDLVGLAPGLAEVFASRAASFLSIAGGHLGGLLTTRMLAPGERAEEVVTLRAGSRIGP